MTIVNDMSFASHVIHRINCHEHVNKVIHNMSKCKTVIGTPWAFPLTECLNSCVRQRDRGPRRSQ